MDLVLVDAGLGELAAAAIRSTLAPGSRTHPANVAIHGDKTRYGGRVNGRVQQCPTRPKAATPTLYISHMLVDP